MQAALVGCLACLVLPVFGALHEADLKRARTWKPRSGFRGQGTLASANAQLNKHLAARTGLRTRACEDYTVSELREVLRTLLPHGSPELKDVYSEKDGRSPRSSTLAELEAEWAHAPSSDLRVRDAHCHEAVMWFIHHLPIATQKALQGLLTLPLLPVAQHTVAARDTSDSAGKFYDSKITCQACHNGGIGSLGLPEVKPETAKAKARRCYTNYKDLFGVSCGPCDGVGGPYWGDSDDDFTPTECVVVGTPEEIPESERVKNVLPSQFSVDVVGGSDRFGRTTNPVHDQLPGPVAKIYGQISGKWYMDAKPDKDLWMLRHDTQYASVTENGVPIPFIKPSVTEIHAQTAKMRASNDTGPMVSLIHGMPSFLPGGCTCMSDPVGVPDITASAANGLNNMEYMGRIKLTPIEYLNRTVELDHWANWFFHIFMETDSTSPYYRKAPRRLASAYAGTAVYDNWVFEDPTVQNPDIWHRGIPTEPERVGPSAGKFCMNTKRVPGYCDTISADSFPQSLLETPAVGESKPSSFPNPFFRTNSELADKLAEQIAARAAQIVV